MVKIDDVVMQNAALMYSQRPGGMSHVLRDESMGGNAGKYGKYSCYAANFFYDESNGRLCWFWTGELRQVPSAIQASCGEGLFRLAVNLDPFLAGDRVVEIVLPELILPAAYALQESAREYNQLFGFPDESLQRRGLEISICPKILPARPRTSLMNSAERTKPFL